ncbi:MAG: hypothetical protein DLM56_06285 [Pseudonocardiales bacterium]|nr:MAG: hypothetical protein DLM56_06285 [Pseudonocardiales bacterium]
MREGERHRPVEERESRTHRGHPGSLPAAAPAVSGEVCSAPAGENQPSTAELGLAGSDEPAGVDADRSAVAQTVAAHSMIPAATTATTCMPAPISSSRRRPIRSPSEPMVSNRPHSTNP